ncbi:MAG: hypothetical protein ACOZNI_30245 [Myxococcota bacterium]
MLAFLSVALFAGCPHPAGEPGGADLPEAAGGGTAVRRLPLPGLRDVACAQDAGCVALAGERIVDLATLAPVRESVPADHDVVRHAEGTWVTERAPEPAIADDLPPIAEDAEQFRLGHNRAVANGWRAGFGRVLVAPGGALVTWARGTEGTGQLVRAGGAAVFVRIPAASAPVSYPAWLALHPTGTEAYLLPWPSDALTAFDPVQLQTRWSVRVGGPAVGLFLDADGRWLIAQTGPDETDRFVDWPLPAFVGEAPGDPLADERVRAFPRPPARETVLVDLARRAVAVRVAGAFRGWLADGGRRLLATDREVVIFNPPEAS